MGLKNQRGQSMVEAILMMVILFVGVTVVSNFFRNKNVFAKLVQSPWEHIAGMAETGVWGESKNTKKLHPNHLARHSTPEPR